MTEIEWLNIFADNLASIMYESKINQRDLSEMSGLSEATISKILRKQQMPKIRAVLNISYAIGISLDDLMDFGDKIIDN